MVRVESSNPINSEPSTISAITATEIESPNVFPQLTLSYTRLASNTTEAPKPRIRAIAPATAVALGARGRVIALANAKREGESHQPTEKGEIRRFGNVAMYCRELEKRPWQRLPKVSWGFQGRCILPVHSDAKLVLATGHQHRDAGSGLTKIISVGISYIILIEDDLRGPLRFFFAGQISNMFDICSILGLVAI